MSQKNVLVIGGGAAGHQIAYQLRDAAAVTLVDPKTYLEVPMAVPRLLVEPGKLPAQMRYDSFLGNAAHMQGEVSALTGHSARVVLEGGVERTVSFDYAVIATGSTYMDPLIKAQAKTEPARAAEIFAMNAKLRAARSVVVAGGGPVGVETAAELREAFPDLKVTLVHGGAKLLERAPSHFPRWAEETLRKRNVDIVLNDMVTVPSAGEQPTGGKVRTQSGRILPGDVVIWAGGVKPVTGFVAAAWPNVVDANGLLKVDQNLRLEGHPTIFVAGDVTNLPEGRLAIIGGLHAKSVAANLKTLLAAQDPAAAKLKPYKPSPPGKGMGKMMIVTLGRNDGLTSLPFGQFRAAFLARQIKSRDMLVKMMRKGVGLTMQAG